MVESPDQSRALIERLYSEMNYYRLCSSFGKDK
jgi:hypothetical protein